MAQFASSLHPQTNPSNPILIKFREVHGATGNDIFSDALLFSSDMFEDTAAYWTNRAQWTHAMSVLTKILAAHRQARPTG